SQTRTTQLVAIAGLTGLVTAFFLGYALLSHRRHRAELIRLAERDELTGLLNRRAIVRKAVEYLTRAREAKGTLILGLIDDECALRLARARQIFDGLANDGATIEQ